MFLVIDEKNNDIRNINKIFPIKQNQVAECVRAIKDFVNKIVVFGSSITWDCNYESDLDLYISLKNEKDFNKVTNVVNEITKYNSDIIFEHRNKNLTKNLDYNINKLGVCVYEHIY